MTSRLNALKNLSAKAKNAYRLTGTSHFSIKPVSSSTCFIKTSPLHQQCSMYHTTHPAFSTQTAEKTVGSGEKHEFMAETRQLLNIVSKSLYSEKEVFIRELISNASDAIEKLKYTQLSEAASAEGQKNALPFEIHINPNDITQTLTIQDTGLGMTKDEMIKNLGTIAHSGSKAFLENLSKDSSNANAKNIIGQFGVGFYSAFMVADKVEVFSQSYKPDEKAYQWVSTGDGTYEITEAQDVTRGTKIIMHLKSDAVEFAKEDNIKKIIKKYSNFVGFPIFVNNERQNLVQALWLEDPKNITEEQHDDFYKFIGNPYDKPRYILQYKADSPLNIRALFYIPSYKPSMFDVGQENDIGVSLYSKKVLILSKANQILPRWLRFIKGVVDSEDIPLNLSRELLQDSNLIKKLKSILTSRIVRFLNEESRNDDTKFSQFYEDYKLYFKEAIAKSNDQIEKEEIASLLRFETSKTELGKHVTLSEYIQRMKPDQNNIYYFAAPTRELAMSSPYFEAIKQKDYEILFLFEPHDEVVILQLGEYKRKKLVGIEQEIETDKTKDDLIIEGDSRSLSNVEATKLKDWLKTTMKDKVKNIKITTKLETHPCVVTTAEMGAIRHFIKTNILQRDKTQNILHMLNLSLEINPRNELIKALYSLHEKEPDLAKMLADQLLDNALVIAGLIEDPRLVLSNLNKLLEKVFQNRK